MARTAVSPSPFTDNAGLTDPAGTTLDPTNGHSVAPVVSSEQLVLRLAVTTTGGNVTIKAGFNGGSDLVVNVPNSTTKWIGPLSSQKYLQVDSLVNVDLAAGMTGKITAFTIDRVA